jgi:hypothetical protein
LKITYVMCLLMVFALQEVSGADLKSAIIGEWRFENGSFIRLNPKGGFRKDDIRGSYSFVSDSLIRFEYRDSSQGKEVMTKQFFYLVKMINDTAMSVESAIDEKFSVKEILRLRRPNPIEQNRNAVMMDLIMLAAKAQQFYQKPSSLGGGGNSFDGLTADSAGIAILASTAFTNNINGTYTIKTAGNTDSAVFRGVGKVKLNDGTYPTYDLWVSPISTIPRKIN